MFVLAWAVCGVRIISYLHHGSSGVAGKIHENNPELRQGCSTCEKIRIFGFGDVSGPLKTRDPRSRADAQWISHMARRIGFREQAYTGTRKYDSAGKIGASDPVKLCVRFGWFFIDIFWNLCSFGLGLFVEPGDGLNHENPTIFNM